MDISLKVPQISKKGKKYIKSTITWKIEILRKKNFFAIFFQKSIKSYIRYLLPLKKGKVYFRYFLTSVKSPDFCCTIYTFFAILRKFLTKKSVFILIEDSLTPPKRVKEVKKGTWCTFLNSTSFGPTPPQILTPIVNRGKFIQNGDF